MTNRLRMTASALVVAAVVSSRVEAWGNEAHQIVCAVAYKLLSQPDRDEVDRLTRLFRAPDGGRFHFFTHGCRFADRARTMARSENEATAKRWRHYAQFETWHFLNVPRTTRVVDEGACGKTCVLHGIEQHRTRLRDRTLPDAQRAEALLLLGHWVGDVHQPLHVSYQDDRGGNRIAPISGFYASDHLHAVWDSGIPGAARGSRDWWTFSGVLHAGITPELQKEWVGVPMKEWAQESYDITTHADTRYCRMDKDRCRAISGGRHLTVDYQNAFGEPVELRLQKAGTRLAALIEQALRP